MKRKFLSALFALVLAFSLVGFGAPAVPVGAQEETLQVVPFELSDSGGSCVAEWSQAQAKTGSSSVKLHAGFAGNDWAEVVLTPPPGITLDDVATITSGWSWWYYIATADFGQRGTAMELYFESATDPDGWAEMTIMDKAYGTPAHGGPPTLDAWTEQTIVGATTKGCVFGVEEDGTTIAQWPNPAGPGEETIANMVAQLKTLDTNAGNWVLTAVRPTLGWIGADETIAYIDDVTINGVTYYGLIQDAIDSATGTTINVAAGTYEESITIDEADLTVQSLDGAATTIIDAGGGDGPVVDITSNGVTFSGFTVQNVSGDEVDGYGIKMFGVGGCTISDCAIKDISSNNVYVFGLRLNAASNNTVSNITISNLDHTGTAAENHGAWGVWLGTSDNNTFTDITVSDITATSDAQGVMLYDGNDSNSFTDTTISALTTTGTGYVYPVGVSVYQASNNNTFTNTSISDVEITGADGWAAGVQDRGITSGTTDNEYINTSISDITSTLNVCGIVVDAGSSATFNGGSIQNLTGGGEGYVYGVRIKNASSAASIENMSISVAGEGVHIFDTTDASLSSINYCDIVGNTDYGINNEDDAIVDAEFNHWGHASGPTHTSNTGGTGDEISANVDYSPWLESTVGTSPMTFHVNISNSSDDIHNAIEDALEGDTILVDPGTYDPISIGKSLTIQSTGGWQKTTIAGGGDVVYVEGFAGTLLFGGGVGTGFEITGGDNGIYIEDLDGTASVTITDCFIWDNLDDGIHCGGVDPGATLTVEKNIITYNGGDGMDFRYPEEIIEGTVTIYHNVIGAWYGEGPSGEPETYEPYQGNCEHGIQVWELGMTGTMTIDYNIIAENGGCASNGINVIKVGAHPDAQNPNRGLHITNNAIGAWEFWYDAEHHATVGGNYDDGIEIVQSLPATFINIQGNAISENQSAGIDLGNGYDVDGTVTIVHNMIGAFTWYPGEQKPPMPGPDHLFGGNWGEGIRIYGIGETGNVLIEENLIAENGAGPSGIHVDSYVYGVLDILRNQIGAWTDAHDVSYGGNNGPGVFINGIGGGDGNAVVTIAGNTVSENTDFGIDIVNIDDKKTTVSIDGNTIAENADHGIHINSADRYAIVGITQNFISGHEDDAGIYLGSDADGIDIVCNIITDNAHGIYVEGYWTNISRNEISNNVSAGTGIYLTLGSDNTTIHYNNIIGNSAQISGGVYSYGVYQVGSETEPVDATNNWWGAADGPGGSGPGSGDWVNDLVIYDPWVGKDDPEATPFDLPCLPGGVGEEEAPVIDDKGASPSVVSLWCDYMFKAMWGDGKENNTYSVGPSGYEDGQKLPVFYVVAHDDDSGVASVTMNMKDLLFDLIPEEKLDKFIDQLDEESLVKWEMYLAELEAWPMKYRAEHGCWHESRGITILLWKTIKFFDDKLGWDKPECKVIVTEIMGQELNLGDHQVEVTVTDFKGNPKIDYIPITIVDFQMPVCEGWNLRSTWLSLQNNSWQDIAATMDEGNADSILRWNSDEQRWEDFRGAPNYTPGWYYGNDDDPVADALMQPLEAYWIHSLANDQFGLITSRGVTAPPSRQMNADWNLIGADIPWEYSSMPPCMALLSAYEAEEHCTGYTQVLSVDQENKWEEDLWVCDSWERFSDYYEKKFWQDTWVFTRGEAEASALEECYQLCFIMDIWDCDGVPPCLMECFYECMFMDDMEGNLMTRGGGYWVFMNNPSVLGGFNSTPLPAGFWYHYWWNKCW